MGRGGRYINNLKTVKSSINWHFWRNRLFLLTKNALLEKGPKKSAWLDHPPLFGQCPKENVFLLMSSLMGNNISNENRKILKVCNDWNSEWTVFIQYLYCSMSAAVGEGKIGRRCLFQRLVYMFLGTRAWAKYVVRDNILRSSLMFNSSFVW